MRTTARAIIFNSQNQMLLVKHHGSQFFSLPGGKLEMGEDLQACLQREIFEELGVGCTVFDLQYVHEFRYSPESDVTVEFFFAVTIDDETITMEKGEHSVAELHDIQWVFVSLETVVKPDFLKTYLPQNHKLEYISLV